MIFHCEVKSRKIITVGRLPQPITGENLCRMRLEETLRGAGVATELVNRIEHAYVFNRDRIRRSASEAAEAAQDALSVSMRVSRGYAAMVLAAALLYALYHWVSLPETNDV